MKRLVGCAILAATLLDGAAYAGLTASGVRKTYVSGELSTAADRNADESYMVALFNQVAPYFPGDSLKVYIVSADSLVPNSIAKIVLCAPLVSVSAADSLNIHLARLNRINADSVYIGGKLIAGFSDGATAGYRSFRAYLRGDTLTISDSLTVMAGAKVNFAAGSATTMSATDVDTLIGAVRMTGLITAAAGITVPAGQTVTAGAVDADTLKNGVRVEGTAAFTGPVTSALAPAFSTGLTAATVRIGGATRDSALTGTGGHFTGGLKVDGASTLTGLTGVGGAILTGWPLATRSSGGSNIAVVGRDNSTIDEAQIGFFHNDGTTPHGYVEGKSSGLSLYGGGTETLRLTSAGQTLIGTSTASAFAAGPSLTILQPASTNDNILEFQSGDVAHGMTDQANTNTYARFMKASGTAGGLEIRGFNDAGDSKALDFLAINGAAANTTHSTSGAGVVQFNVGVKNGTTGAAVGANGNLMAIVNWGTTAWLLDAEGDTWQSGGATLGGGTPVEGVSTHTVLQLGGNGYIHHEKAAGASTSIWITNNAAYNTTPSTRWEYISTDEASNYYQYEGTHVWQTAASGTADSSITWSTVWTMETDGDLIPGGTDATQVLGSTAASLDSAYIMDVATGADIPFLDGEDDVAAICAIKGSGQYDARGRELVDDWTLPKSIMLIYTEDQTDTVVTNIVTRTDTVGTDTLWEDRTVPDSTKVVSYTVKVDEEGVASEAEPIYETRVEKVVKELKPVTVTVPVSADTTLVPHKAGDLVLTASGKPMYSLSPAIGQLQGAVRQLKARDDSLQARIEALESQNASLQSTLTEVLTRLDKLEAGR